MKFPTNPHNNTHLTLGMLLHYLGILKIQIFSKYSADIEKCKQLHFQCTDFNSSACITLFAKCVMCFYHSLVLIGECHVDC